MKRLLLTPVFKSFKKVLFSSLKQNTFPFYDGKGIKKQEQQESIKSYIQSFGSDNPFMLLAKLKVQVDKVAKYLEIADKTDKAFRVDGPGMLHNTFDQDSYDPPRLVLSELYKNDDALLAHLANLAGGVYLEAHAKLGTDFFVQFYGTVGEKLQKPSTKQEFHIRSLK